MANKSNRKITKHQFQEGTTIDGDRLQDAVDDVADKFNNLEKACLRNIYFKTQFVGGFSPNRTAGQADTRGYLRQSPFMASYNKNAGKTNPALLTYLGDNENAYRNKGFEVTDIIDDKTFNINMTGASGASQGTFWTLEIPLEFKKPVIITDLVFYLFVDPIYNGGHDEEISFPYPVAGNAFQWLQDFADGNKIAHQWADDLQIQVQVDNPYKPEDRELTAVELHKFKFKAYSQLTVTPVYNAAASAEPSTLGNNDMVPAPAPNANIGKNGLAIEIKDIDLPIPKDGRVRVSLLIPQYSVGYTITSPSTDLTAIAPHGIISPNNYRYSWCITALEEIENK